MSPPTAGLGRSGAGTKAILPFSSGLPSRVTWPRTSTFDPPHPEPAARTTTTKNHRSMEDLGSSEILDDFITGDGSEGLPGAQRHGLADEADRAVTEEYVD